MLNLKQPPALVTFALNSLIDLVHLSNGYCTFDTHSYQVLREYLLWIPNNLYDQWAEKLLLASSRTQVKSDAHFLVFSPALTRLNIDEFPTHPINIHTLSRCFQLSVNLRQLHCRYAPFFWSPQDLIVFQNSILHLKNLQKLVLCNISLMESPTFLETVGTSCKNIKELDISYGKLPISSYKTICEAFSNLEVLRMRQHSEEFRTITQKEAIYVLTCLLKLKVLDEDTTVWSCILPAFKQLSKEMYSDSCACLEQLTIYQQCSDVNLKFMKMIVSVCLDSKIFKQSSNQNIADWLFNSFPSLRLIDLRLDNVWFPAIENFLQTETIGWKVHSIILSKIPMNFRHFQVIGRYATNLKRFEVINKRPLDEVVIEDLHHLHQNLAAEVRFCQSYFRNLEHLSFTGIWDENISSLLLDHSIHLRELQLRTQTLPMQFLNHNPLSNLCRLLFDISHIMWNTSILFVYDLEKDFLRRVLPSASTSLKEIRLKSRPSQEWESLLQQLKMANCDLQILRPI